MKLEVLKGINKNVIKLYLNYTILVLSSVDFFKINNIMISCIHNI